MSLVPSLLKKPESILEKLCGFLKEQNVELSSLCAGLLFQPASRGALLVASVVVGVRGRAVSGRPLFGLQCQNTPGSGWLAFPFSTLPLRRALTGSWNGVWGKKC